MYEELIKSLRQCAEASCAGCKNDWVEFGCRGKLQIEAADAIEELCGLCANQSKDCSEAVAKYLELWEKQPHWIPVTERLPNCNGCYLVWRPHFFGGEIGMPSICYFDGTNTWHDSYGVDFTRILHSEDVTHWMPLPEPPKEET